VEKRKFFEVTPASAPGNYIKFKGHSLERSGSTIVDWLNQYLKCTSRTEAKQLAQLLVDHSYLIPMNLDFEQNMDDSDAMYTFQAR
jgi:hypothetical protein